MPTIRIDDTLDMYYELDSFVEPWREPEVVLLVHGIGGSTAEWYAWVPPIASRYAVARIDLRGWGQSTVPPEGYGWSMDNFADDIRVFMDRMGIERVHLLGTKLGGRVALHFAVNHPDRLHTLSLVSTPMSINRNPQDSRDRRPTMEGGLEGMKEWNRATMRERLGDVPQPMMDWWIDLYDRVSPRVMAEVFDLAWDTDEYALLPKISVPTLVVDSDFQEPFDEIRKWQTTIPRSTFVPVPITANEGRQIPASKPAECVAALLEFLDDLPSA